MQKFGKTIITDSGRKMLVEVDGAKGQLTYTRAALFKQDIKGLSEDDQIALTELIGQQIETPLEVTQIQDTTVTVSASFNNSKVSQDLPFNTIGWYAKTSVDNVEQLMAVTPSLTEQTLVAGVEGASTSALDIDMVFGRSHNTTVVLSPKQAGVVSAPQLAASIQKLKIELKELGLLNDSDGNNIYNTTINLDTYSTVGITKFLECKLQSSGKMSGFDQATDKLYGWIFNMPKWNGASELQQIVYICNYGQGTLTYARSRVNGEGTNVENFEKILTDKDLKAYADGVNKLVESAGKVKQISVNGGNPVSPDSTGTAPLKIPVFAPNLLKGTSDQGQSIPTNTATDIVHLTTDGNTKYTVAVDIDYSAFSVGSAGATLQVNNGGTVVESTRITAGSKGRVSVTFTTPSGCLWVTVLISSNSSYNGIYSCLKASQWQDNNTPPDMTYVPSINDYYSELDTKAKKDEVYSKAEVDKRNLDLQNQITANLHETMKTWVGTLEQYQAMATHEPMTMYFIISDYEVVVK